MQSQVGQRSAYRQRSCSRPHESRRRRLRVCALVNPGGHPPTSPQGWAVMRQELVAAGVKVMSPQEMVFKSQEEQRAVVIDVRPQEDYDKGHVPGALNVPFYQLITGWSPFKVARRLGYAAFGVMKGTEVNPDFQAEVQQLVSSHEMEIILYCAQGGVLESNENYAKGWQTRSLIAAYELKQAGLSNTVSVMRGGFSEWCSGGRDIEVMEFVDELEEDKQLSTTQ